MEMLSSLFHSSSKSIKKETQKSKFLLLHKIDFLRLWRTISPKLEENQITLIFAEIYGAEAKIWNSGLSPIVSSLINGCSLKHAKFGIFHSNSQQVLIILV